jgi:AAA ATPase domain
MNDADSLFIKTIYNNLTEDALEPDSKFYEPIYDAYANDPDYTAPIDKLFNQIKLTNDAVGSAHFFSGYRGSGKTTELKRLKKKLESEGFIVLYANALDYINPGAPIDISDLLITLAGAFSDQIEQITKQDPLKESYWQRFFGYITRTKVEIKEIGFDLQPASIKAELKESPSFRSKIQAALANHISQINQEVRKFFQDGVQKVKQLNNQKPVVFIFDSLEQLRGTRSNEIQVQQSVESIFGNHLGLLELPNLHMVYTVPPWLKLVLPGAVEVVLLPSIRLWKKTDTGERPAYPEGIKRLRNAIQRRLGDNPTRDEWTHWERFFGQDHAIADELIRMSGGHFRDLIRMLRFTITSLKTLPATPSLLQKAISNLRSQYLPINTQDALRLAQIDRSRTIDYNSDEVDSLSRLLDLHVILYLVNGDDWYDVHPVILDEVKRIEKNQVEQATQG